MTRITPTQTPAWKMSPTSSQPARLTIETSGMMEKISDRLIAVLRRCNYPIQTKQIYIDSLTCGAISSELSHFRVLCKLAAPRREPRLVYSLLNSSKSFLG
jgi:hypothetical protein